MCDCSLCAALPRRSDAQVRHAHRPRHSGEGTASVFVCSACVLPCYLTCCRVLSCVVVCCCAGWRGRRHGRAQAEAQRVRITSPRAESAWPHVIVGLVSSCRLERSSAQKLNQWDEKIQAAKDELAEVREVPVSCSCQTHSPLVPPSADHAAEHAVAGAGCGADQSAVRSGGPTQHLHEERAREFESPWSASDRRRLRLMALLSPRLRTRARWTIARTRSGGSCCSWCSSRRRRSTASRRRSTCCGGRAATSLCSRDAMRCGRELCCI